MSKVIIKCVLPNAAELINGVRFEQGPDAVYSEPVDVAVAERFASIEGYSIVEPKAPATTAEDKPAAKPKGKAKAEAETKADTKSDADAETKAGAHAAAPAATAEVTSVVADAPAGDAQAAE